MIRAGELRQVAVNVFHDGHSIIATTLPKGAVDIYIDGDHYCFCKMRAQSFGFVRNNSDLVYTGLIGAGRMPQEVLDEIFDMVEKKCKVVT